MSRNDGNHAFPDRGGARALMILCAAAAVLLTGCTGGVTMETISRTLTFSVPACLFGSSTATNVSDRGPGIDTVTVTVSLSGGTAASATGSLDAASFGSGSYASFTIDVDGELTGISVSGTSAGTEVVSASATDFPEAEMTRYGGYSAFGNVLYFKLDWSGGDSTTGMLRLLPCPRASTQVLADVGAQSGAGKTDRASTVTSLQVAVQPVAAEDNTDETLTYTAYYAVSDIDPSIAYSTATLEGTHLQYPWTAQWTWAEVTGSAGKTIGETAFVMSKVTGSEGKVVGVEDDYGKLSALIDLNGKAEVGQYLLYCVILTRQDLSVPTDVEVVQVK